MAEVFFGYDDELHIFHDHLVSRCGGPANVTWSHNYLDATQNYYHRLIGSSVNRQQHGKRFLMKCLLK